MGWKICMLMGVDWSFLVCVGVVIVVKIVVSVVMVIEDFR